MPEPLTAVWRNGGCNALYDSFVVDSSAVLLLNFYAKNPPLRQAPSVTSRNKMTKNITMDNDLANFFQSYNQRKIITSHYNR